MLAKTHVDVKDIHAAGASDAAARTTLPHSPIRVCHLAYSFYESDNRILRYAESLAERGDQVDVIALRAPGRFWREESRGVRVYRIQRRSETEKSAWAYLIKILWFFLKSTVLVSVLAVKRRYDVVHVHNMPDFLVFAAVVPKVLRARVILDIHDILPELYADKFGKGLDSGVFQTLLRVERLCCRFAHHVIVANHLWHDKLIIRSVASSKCTPLMNYPDLRLFTPLPKDGRRKDGKFIMLYPGTLSRLQGLDLAIKAFALVSASMPGAELHIYGEGGTRSELEHLTRSCGLERTVRFSHGMSLEEISKVIAAADVGVVPKRAEGFGNEAFSTKTLEFMACGVPVIASRTRVDTYDFDDSLVRFFTPGDEVDLSRAMLWAFEHRIEHASQAQLARDFAVRHSWQERSGEYLGLVDSLVIKAGSHSAVGAIR